MLKKMVGIMLCLLFMAPAVSARTISGVDLPETLTFDGITLGLNGGGTRMEFIIKAYVAGLYLQEAMTDPQKVIDADEPMAIRMHVTTRMATSKRMKKALYKGFRGTVPRGDVSAIKDKITQFDIGFSDEVHSGQEIDVVYIPNKGTSVYRDGVLKTTVPGYEFKKNVFGIWLGSRPASEKLKKNMVAGDFRVAIAKINVAKAAQEAKAKAEAAKLAAAKKAKAEEAAKMAAAEKAKAEAAKMAAAEKAKAEAAKMAAAQEAARMKAAREAKARAMAKLAKMAAAKKAKAEESAKMAAAQETARMKAAREAKARKDARLAAEAEKRAAQAKALEVKAKKAALAPMTTSVTEAQVVGEDIMFGFNSAKLSAKAEKLLAKKVEWLKANPDKKVAIQVFCDPSGSRVYNEYLAGKRARSVVKGLTAAGISKGRIEILNFEFGKSRRAHFTVK